MAESKEIEFSLLLMKYMRFLLDYHGDTFVEDIPGHIWKLSFTKNELAVLQGFDKGI